jgi:hypothetical protein
MRANPLLSELKDIPKAFGKGALPAIMPGGVLRYVTVVGDALEAELASGRFASFVEGCELAAEDFGVWHVVLSAASKVVELGQVKVNVAVACKGAPGD